MNKDMILLQQGAKLLGIELDDEQLALFDLYQSELLKWNAKTNLISEKTAGEIVVRHFLDSLTAAKHIIPFMNSPHPRRAAPPPPAGDRGSIRIVDIGSGAGFPGIPLKIALPSLQLYLLETNRKKVSFLKHIIRTLYLDQTQTLHDRTENIVRENAWRGYFDIVISRASLKLPDLLPLGDYFLAPGGLLITLKGRDIATELAAALQSKNTSQIYQLYQHDINLPLLGPPRKIIILQKAK
ncbi:MAG TPA: 16S rRNA (guanine(527)-N(7))-methyltransferase RsmG [Syntrophaceae bacterium]|nr:16S rRNA (guanine(527)-N(7))-methyltransferase RsmG [Syntrophaceae bacterium]